MKKTTLLSLFAALFITVAAPLVAQETESAAVRHVADGTILQCWCWSFNTIKDNMKQIADAGFTALQTSPINTCRIGEYGGLALMSKDTSGKWYFHYQPTDWKIGNYQLGTRDEFKAMCDEAKKYNITVIVDVLPNHTTQVNKFSRAEMANLFAAVGGEDKLYHANGLKNISDYNKRSEVISEEVGGLPDVNTENPDFQAYFMTFMNDAIDCGAGGFRFDTAKHIALPDDPKDPSSPENDFWEIFTGKKDIRGVSLHNSKDLFEYGEVLQGGASREADYPKYLRVVASSYGANLRMAIRFSNLSTARISNYSHPADPSRLITWIESHDTYANQGESAKMTNFQLRVGYALITARQLGTPLFFSRPQGPEATQFPGVSQIGDIGNDQFHDPEVSAVNHFRTAVAGEPEKLSNGASNAQLIIERGSKGFVLINMDKDASTFKFETQLPDGTYIDHAHEKKYTIKKGAFSGRVPGESIIVIY